jgi:hypothetical protein
MPRIAIPVCVVVILCVATQVATADNVLTPISQFVGDYSEGFESLYGDHKFGPVEILGGQATLYGVNAPAFSFGPLYFWDVRVVPTGLGSNGFVVPFDGFRGLTVQADYQYYTPRARLEFTVPIRQFGGYWAHGLINEGLSDERGGPIHFQFFDANNSVIATADFTYDTPLQGILEWAGWNTSVPVKAVEFESYFPVVDGLQIVVVPEPSGLVIAGTALAVAILCCRRRLGIYPGLTAPRA